jgi:hypothetical protein
VIQYSFASSFGSFVQHAHSIDTNIQTLCALDSETYARRLTLDRVFIRYPMPFKPFLCWVSNDIIQLVLYLAFFPTSMSIHDRTQIRHSNPALKKRHSNPALKSSTQIRHSNSALKSGTQKRRSKTALKSGTQIRHWKTTLKNLKFATQIRNSNTSIMAPKFGTRQTDTALSYESRLW